MYDVTTWLTNDYNTHLPNISRSKGNQTMKFGQLIEYNRNIFLQNHAGNEAGRLVPELSLLFKKVSYNVIASGL